jgi:hypothetical protein
MLTRFLAFYVCTNPNVVKYNWSSDNFTPLDAEVEVKKNSKKSRKLENLLTAIQKNKRSKTFLVLGDPGSGKSVALRKLCKDLANEVEITGKLPIYVNLKEWYIEKKWTKNNPPTSNELHEFVLQQLKGFDVHADKFIEKYYFDLLEMGRLFFVFDSFDEIPMVLDEDESSWLIDELSKVFHDTFGANESRGILSSRFFRRPTKQFNAGITLEIRPFTERKIQENLEKSINFNSILLKDLFENRPDLVPFIRNPFINELLNNYIEKNDGRLPKSPAELYFNYIDYRLDACKDIMHENKLNKDEVLSFCENIAFIMFESEEYGLEMPLNDIKSMFTDSSKVSSIIEVLIYGKLSRYGGGQKKKFSFVHRRFNEYFVSQVLLKRPENVIFDHIPNDSRWRDALVLFCELAPDEIARIMAKNCWEEIKHLKEDDITNQQRIRSMHSLRFLADAYRGRKESLELFSKELNDIITYNLTQRDDLLKIKLTVEAVGLLKFKQIDANVRKALEIENNWISETAINSCRHLPSLSNELTNSIKGFIASYGDFGYFKKNKDILFQMRLSNSFENVYKYCVFRNLQLIIFCLTLLAMFAISPIIFLPMFIIYWFSRSDWYFKPTIKPNINRTNRERDNIMTAKTYERIPFFLFIVITFPTFSSNINKEKTETINYIPDFILDKHGIFTTAISNTYNNFVRIMINDYNNGKELILICMMSLFFGPMITSIMAKSSLNFKGWPNMVELLKVAKEEVKDLINTFISWIKEIRIKSIVYILGFACLIIAIFYFYSQIVGQVFYIIFVLLFPILLFFAISFQIIQYLKNLVLDFRTIKKIKSKRTSQRWLRKNIEDIFVSLNTAKGRKKFVLFLEETRIDVDGEWKNKKVPFIENDDSSTKLAQLEERWLGLSR